VGGGGDRGAFTGEFGMAVIDGGQGRGEVAVVHGGEDRAGAGPAVARSDSAHDSNSVGVVVGEDGSMEVNEMRRYICQAFDGVRAAEGSGDTFFLYDPDGDLVAERQIPFVTIVTGDHYDSVSNLNRPGAYRLNIGLTRTTYTSWFGAAPTQRDADGVLETGFDHAAVDTVVPHPIYASQYWVSVVNPGEATLETVRTFLAEAHGFAARKYANHRARREHGPEEVD
jgi:hypothetical protein